MTRLVSAVACALMLVFLVRPALAQAPHDGKLLVTVVDPTGAVIQGATVTVAGLEPATQAATLAPVKTSDKGVASLDGLVVGRYSIQAEFSGFQTAVLKDVRLKSGDNKHVVVLPIKKMEDAVTVSQDKQAAAADRGSAFGTAMTREQIDALSDDPTEMQKQIQAMGGSDGVIRVDGFEGQPLPLKAQIKSIHVTRDAFAAENHYAGGIFIDIVTQPGIGALRGSGRLGFYDSALDGQNPLVPKNGPAQNRNYGGNVGGTLIKNKADFNIGVNGSSNYATPIFSGNTGSGNIFQNLNVRQPSTRTGVNGLLNYAITKDQTMRFSFNHANNTSDNLGIGAFDQATRAYSSSNVGTSFRAQEVGPLGRRFFTNTRFSINRQDSSAHSAIEAPTIIVEDAQTLGGAQRAGSTLSTTFSAASDLDYVRGIHSFRTGVQIEGTRYHSTSESNYLGTYTFANNTDYLTGQALSYTRRIGSPNIAYSNTQAGIYAQDDLRFKKSLTVSAGLRYEAQTHVHDYKALGPRAGITWAPFKNGKTTVRASWGIFYDWLPVGTYGQTVLVDGFHQQQVDLFNPTYPDPGALGAATPTSRFLLAPGLQLAMNKRASLGISEAITKSFSVGATYADVRGTNLLVGNNLNAPVNGVRPDPAFANVIAATADARARTESVSTYFNWGLSGPGVPSTKFFDWRRNLFFFGSYNYRRSFNNTDGAFTPPATGSLAAEWGPSPNDIRHTVFFSLNSSAFKNLSVSVNGNWNSAPPLTILTGFDNNGDSILNDRPAGVGRNSARTSGQLYSYMYISYSVGLGARKVVGQPGIMINGGGVGGLTVTSMAQQPAPRYRLIFSVSIDNPANHQNYQGYSGVMTSSFFLQPTSITGVRKLTFNMSVTF
jgi:hypothetical protein